MKLTKLTLDQKNYLQEVRDKNGKKEKILDTFRKSYNENSSSILGFFEEYRFLSNYHLLDVNYCGITYPSNENAYQAAKVNKEKIKLIFSKLTPGESRSLGQVVTPREDWSSIKYSIMYEVNLLKFKNSELKSKLLETGNKNLVELNWWKDQYWGATLNETGEVVGENNLGRILMKIREELRK